MPFTGKYAPKPYDPVETPLLLLDHLGSGHSFLSFGAIVNVTRETLYNWLEMPSRPEFAEAKKIGELHREKWFEDEIQAARFFGSKERNVAPLLFLAKNMTSMKDIKTVAGNGDDGEIQVKIRVFEEKPNGDKGKVKEDITKQVVNGIVEDAMTDEE
jgi:hypothetical protein